MRAPPAAPEQSGAPIGLFEFVALTAAVMSVNAIGIDMMLPALPQIGAAMNVAQANDQQLVIVVYMFGFGGAQIFYGPLADRFGRIPVAVFGLSLFFIASMVASFATSFDVMLTARAVQGIAAASTRVVSVAMVRDCFSGRQMARVMSLVSLIFMLIPMLAPSIGALVLLFGPWQAIFHTLAGFAALVCLWILLRMRETLAPANRQEIRLARVGAAMLSVVGNRDSLGYTLAVTMIFGGLLGFITSAEQLFNGAFGLRREFPLLFALMASGIGVAQLLNSRIVVRFGPRHVSHTALLAFVLLTAAHVISETMMHDNAARFVVFQFLSMFLFGLMGANFGAMAMDPMGHIAGTASAIQGAITALGGATFGYFVGQAYDGTATPIAVGFLIAAFGALGCVLYAERGRLFRRDSPDASWE